MQYLAAPAKLTLELRICGLRQDGLHLIDAEMVALSLGDELLLEELPPGCRSELVVKRGDSFEAGDPDDLILRALSLTGRAARVELAKVVPPGAGLGGGSADAAAILRWAGHSDLSAAAKLGADVAFCLVGGRAHVRGIGEIVETLEHEPLTVTLLTPPVHCSTPAVYAEWDRLGGPTGDNGNDLEPAAISRFPELLEWRDQLGGVSGQTPRLAGSGSTWWVKGSFPGGGRVVAEAVPPQAAARTA